MKLLSRVREILIKPKPSQELPGGPGVKIGYSPWGPQRVGLRDFTFTFTFQGLRLQVSTAGGMGSIPGQCELHTLCSEAKKKTKTKNPNQLTYLFTQYSHVSHIIWVKAKVLIAALKALNYLPPSLLCYLLDLVFQYSPLCSLLSSHTSLFLVLGVILTSGLFTCWLLFLEPSFLHGSPLHSFRFLFKCHLIK